MKKQFLILVLFLTATYNLNAQKAINLLTYNIRYENKDDKNDLWTNRREEMVEQIKKYKIDILCAQEDLESQAKFLEEGTKLKGTLNERTRGKTGFYNGIYYNEKKFKLLTEGHFFLNESTDTVGKGWDAAGFRFARWVKFYDKKNKNEFYIFNTHFDHKGVVARNQSAKLMLKKISEIAGNAPIILTGDLNAKPTTNPIKTLKTMLKDSREASLSSPLGPEGTFNGFNLERTLDTRIDYIFVNDKVTVNTYEVLAEKTKNGGYISDHLPIRVNLNINK